LADHARPRIFLDITLGGREHGYRRDPRPSADGFDLVSGHQFIEVRSGEHQSPADLVESNASLSDKPPEIPLRQPGLPFDGLSKG
jgi:hypothetical protein